ncbi:AAA family ATPase [Pseudomonas entomophila]|uniref:AAA family ATPase n=1 Tax=Pseudomonas entomophila TaxID=312306 RepID=UPI001F01D688|nr:AAA family ATPase [Pseudomonas entomophila]MCG8293246.1 AAA family ATPase [Pseudomonas entomophila]
MQRIVILGNAGSGKSTLARAIGVRLGLPVVHLDRLFWEPGWEEADDEVFRERVVQALAGGSWVTDGNYSRRTFDLRLPHADLVIWLDTPRLTCLRRVIQRSLLKPPRPDLPQGCNEKPNKDFLEFLKFVWHFDRVSRLGIEALRLAIGAQVPVVHLGNAREVAAFVGGLSGVVSGEGEAVISRSSAARAAHRG